MLQRSKHALSGLCGVRLYDKFAYDKSLSNFLYFTIKKREIPEDII